MDRHRNVIRECRVVGYIDEVEKHDLDEVSSGWYRRWFEVRVWPKPDEFGKAMEGDETKLKECNQ